MTAEHRVHLLALTTGFFFGVGCVYLAVWGATGSSSAAMTFSLIPAAFFLPVVIVFVLAIARASSVRATARSESQQSDPAIAVCYVLSFAPFWFAAIGILQGRLTLALTLLAVYALMAALPLQRLYRVRIDRGTSIGDSGNEGESVQK